MGMPKRLIHRDWLVVIAMAARWKKSWSTACFAIFLAHFPFSSPPNSLQFPTSLHPSLSFTPTQHSQCRIQEQCWIDWRDPGTNHQSTEPKAGTLATRPRLAAVQKNFGPSPYLNIFGLPAGTEVQASQKPPHMRINVSDACLIWLICVAEVVVLSDNWIRGE
jgi:hypothetical protein